MILRRTKPPLATLPRVGGPNLALALNEGAGPPRPFTNRRRVPSSFVSTPDWVFGPGGLGLNFIRTSGECVEITSGNLPNTGPFAGTALPYTVAALMSLGELSAGNDYNVLVQGASKFLLYFPGATGAVSAFMNGVNLNGTASASVGQVVLAGSSWDGTTLRVHLNGRYVGSAAADIGTEQATLHIGSRDDHATNRSYHGMLYAVYFWPRMLVERALADVWWNVWGVWESDVHRAVIGEAGEPPVPPFTFAAQARVRPRPFAPGVAR